MKRVLSAAFCLALLLGLAYLLWPAVQQAQRYTALLGSPAPKSLPNPLPGKRLIDTWGGIRSGGRHHEGIDIFAQRNAPIHATTAGIVLNVGPNELGGRTVMILGPGQQRHYYAHLERYANLKRGQWIGPGDVVGFVGNSGNAVTTPTHLHYGIYTPQGAINPYPLLRRGSGSP